MGELLRELHAHHFDHRDLKALNILVGPKSSTPADAANSSSGGTGCALYLLDLDALWPWRRLPESRRVQNLSRLHVSFRSDAVVSRTDKLRFLKSYLPAGRRGREHWKAVWRQIADRTEAKVQLNSERGRPLW